MNDSPTAASDASTGDRLFSLLQLCLPTRLLSWCIFKLTRIESPGFKNAFIRVFMSRFNISLAEAEFEKPASYKSFNEFFTRALKPDARPQASGAGVLISPVDGAVSQLGQVDGDRIFQAKGHHYTAAELLGGEDLAQPFIGGEFCTIYLAPNNYHRLHMPLTGTLREWVYVPGRLFSVNPATARAMPKVFARNERVAAIFDTEIGPFAMVLVGAFFVGSIETVWAGMISPPHRRSPLARYQPVHPPTLERGAEMGRFNMGSTVILLAPPGALQWNPALGAATPLRMGQAIGIKQRAAIGAVA
ncbi:MAG: Phosphatidylserine decarboxylase proenzyme [Hydrocarboniphaga sp.]|uniref:archaetidylserine decarboxylase n=1 Tax=Hydrocarboniphaga sp. TaxID=2033016 RepID=UPI00261DB5E2|nr:archaetidylserine decarboxylase [Hydrocarboniphaga sp.]MDB5969033.1 Phosphatidylserine decarboxylase proenzyme [Hydrocarboniphaga sp.]